MEKKYINPGATKSWLTLFRKIKRRLLELQLVLNGFE